jgi:hypothetical protein
MSDVLKILESRYKTEILILQADIQKYIVDQSFANTTDQIDLLDELLSELALIEHKLSILYSFGDAQGAFYTTSTT